jgi:hypothetical protein
LLFKGYGAKVGLGNMRVKAENRMVTNDSSDNGTYGSCCIFLVYCGTFHNMFLAIFMFDLLYHHNYFC